MKKSLMYSMVTTLMFLMLFLNSGCTKKNLETQKDKASYSIGWDIGSNFKKQSIDIDTDILLMGIKNALAGSESSLTEDEMREVMMTFQMKLRKKQTKGRSETREKNKKEGEEFLAKNRQKEGVKTTSSGLQYKVIKEGEGNKPRPDDVVTVNYKGTLIDGTEFDSSYKRGQPTTFSVKGVIPGWTEALQLMKVGSKYELFIPSDIAYGSRGAGGDIGPNATLIFTVELLSIK